MRSEPEVCPPDDRLGGAGCQAHDVGADAHIRGAGDHDYLDIEDTAQLRSKDCGARRTAAGDSELAERPDANDSKGVSAGLHTRAHDRQHSRVGPREQVGRKCRTRGRARSGDLGAVKQRHRLTVRSVEHDHDRLVRRERGTGVSRIEADELSRDGSRRWQVRRHRRHKTAPLLDVSGDAGRHRDTPGAELHHRGRERLPQSIGIEQRLRLGRGKDQHPIHCMRERNDAETCVTRSAPALRAAVSQAPRFLLDYPHRVGTEAVDNAVPTSGRLGQATTWGC